jgi:hypothetical protein
VVRILVQSELLLATGITTTSLLLLLLLTATTTTTTATTNTYTTSGTVSAANSIALSALNCRGCLKSSDRRNVFNC